MHRFVDRVAIVTGGASGIGFATSRAFIAEGGSVVLADVQSDKGEDAAEKLGSSAVFVETDVSDESSVASTVDVAMNRWGRLDLMFNNAGIIGALGPAADISVEDFRRTMAINFDGVFFGIKHAARVMVPAGEGVIVSTSSSAGVLGGIGPHVYSAAKAAVIGLTRSVAAELRPHGVRVNAVVPGSMVTAMNATITNGDPDDLAGARHALEARALLPRPGLPEDVAAGVMYLASDEASFVAGHTLHIDAGFSSAPGTGEPGWQYESAPMMREAGIRGQ